MDLHDTPLVSKEKKLQPGTLLTIEPGEVVTSSCGNQTSFYTLTNCIVKYNQRERERERVVADIYIHMYMLHLKSTKRKKKCQTHQFSVGIYSLDAIPNTCMYMILLYHSVLCQLI